MSASLHVRDAVEVLDRICKVESLGGGAFPAPGRLAATAATGTAAISHHGGVDVTGQRKTPRMRNGALRAFLDQLGWSVTGFAQRVSRHGGAGRSVSPSTVSRWCDGAVPGPDLRGAACQALSVGLNRRVLPRDLGWPNTHDDVAGDALRYGDLGHAVEVLSRLWQVDSLRGRSALGRMSFGGASTPAMHDALVMLPDSELVGLGRLRVSEADVELLEMHTDLYGRLDARHGGGRFRSVFAAFLDAHATPLLRGGFSARLGARLFGSVADAVLALASMAYDDQLPGLASRYDLQAMRLAQAVGDRGRLARGYIHQARLAEALAEPAEALTHARSAVVAAGRAPLLVRAYAAVSEARAWAFNSEPQQTLASVRRARQLFDRTDAGAGPRWLGWLDRPELEGQVAWAFAMAGLVGPGVEALQAANEMPAERVRDSVELLLTGAELARLRGDDGEHELLIKRAAASSRHLKSRRLAQRLERAGEGRALRDC